MDGLIKLVSFVTIVIFLPGQTVLGRGCYRDPKIYTVKVAAESQHVLILKAMIKCLNSTAPLDEKLKGQYCPSIFDNVMCWPHTRAGIVLQQNCPDYINNFNTQEKARRECLSNGTWFIHPETNATWTDFTQCMRPYNPTDPLMEDLPKIERLNMIGYSVSLTFLSVAVVVMLSLKRLHCQRNYIHINLFVSFVLRSIICLVKDVFHTPDGDTRVINNTVTLTTLGSNWPCKLLFSIFNYIIVANYTWIFLEGLFLHNIIFVTTFKNSKRFFMYILFGWCSPLLCIIPWVIVRRLLEDTLCWSTHSAENKFVWIIRGPIVVTIAINFLFFLNIIRVLFTKLTAVHMSDPHRYRKLARSTLVLIPLFGVYYMISVVMPECMDPSVELIWLYVESGVNSFQGLVVAVLFCFCNGEVQQEILKRWNRQRTIRRFSTISTKSTRTMSLGSTVFVKDKAVPSAMFSDVTLNVNIDDKSTCHVGLKDSQCNGEIVNNNSIGNSGNGKVITEEDTLL